MSTDLAAISVSADELATGISDIDAAMATQQDIALFEETTATGTALNHEAQPLTSIV